MTAYRRFRVEGGTYFFTVNVADRHRKLLTDHIGALREVFRVGWVERSETHQFRVGPYHGRF
jgi:REP element-mobilizing transposase RayT